MCGFSFRIVKKLSATADLYIEPEKKGYLGKVRLTKKVQGKAVWNREKRELT